MTREERLALDGDPNAILFYGRDGEHASFSNFSPHEVTLPHPFTGELITYDTVEHRYQAMKAGTQGEHDWVWLALTPGESKRRGRKVLIRPQWDTPPHGIAGLGYYVMLEAVQAKIFQHRDVRELLLSTGDHVIYEDSPTDDIWGWRREDDHSGRNLLGRVLMLTRTLTRGPAF